MKERDDLHSKDHRQDAHANADNRVNPHALDIPPTADQHPAHNPSPRPRQPPPANPACPQQRKHSPNRNHLPSDQKQAGQDLAECELEGEEV
jgi:hypothetical protein